MKEKSRKLFEKVDDNPGVYFSMLVEGYDSTYASVMKQADSDAQKLRDSWEKDGGKSLFDTLSELGYESDYEDSPYMFKDADGGNTIVFDLRPINSFEDYVTYYVVDKDNRIPDGWTKTKLMIDFWKDKNESLKESHNNIENIVTSVNKFPYSGKIVYMNEIRTPLSLSNDFNRINEFKADVSKCKSLDELVHILKKYFAYDGSPINLTVIDDNNKYTKLSFKVFEDGETKIIIFHKNYQSNESLKEDKNELSIVGEFETGEDFGQSAGTSKKNQAIFRAKALMKMKGLSRAKVINAKGNVVWDSDTMLKEDKFVSRDKMSKKDKKELDSQKRNTWGNTNPVTRVQPNKKAYDRKRDNKVVDEDIENKDSEEYLGVDEVKRFVNAREKLLDISDSMTTDLRLGRISREDVLYYRNEIKEIYSFLNSLYFGR